MSNKRTLVVAAVGFLLVVVGIIVIGIDTRTSHDSPSAPRLSASVSAQHKSEVASASDIDLTLPTNMNDFFYAKCKDPQCVKPKTSGFFSFASSVCLGDCGANCESVEKTILTPRGTDKIGNLLLSWNKVKDMLSGVPKGIRDGTITRQNELGIFKFLPDFFQPDSEAIGLSAGEEKHAEVRPWLDAVYGPVAGWDLKNLRGKFSCIRKFC
jgi:hypothetical protein